MSVFETSRNSQTSSRLATERAVIKKPITSRLDTKKAKILKEEKETQDDNKQPLEEW
jgi:hypothetical protein